ncbi:VOC family protein [Croceiramulus getboli]|nr:VOC family protein [Flavobacteriaceae bacterium YJPT1-3]
MRSLVLPFAFFASLTLTAQSSLTLDHQAIEVDDLERSATFYMDILGLEEIEDGTGLDHIRWFSLGGDRSLHLIENDNRQPAPSKGIHMALRSNDLDATLDALREKKIYFENWPGEANQTNDRPDGIRQIYLQDPDGYWIEINGK